MKGDDSSIWSLEVGTTIQLLKCNKSLRTVYPGLEDCLLVISWYILEKSGSSNCAILMDSKMQDSGVDRIRELTNWSLDKTLVVLRVL